MANHLTLDQETKLADLLASGWSARKVSRAIGISFNTVLKRAQVIRGVNPSKRRTKKSKVGKKTAVSQTEHERQVNVLRADMVEAFHQNRFQTRDDLVESFLPRYPNKQALTHIFLRGLSDESYRLNRDGLSAPPNRRRERLTNGPEPYIRKSIPNEHETDIQYLTRLHGFLSLDEVRNDDGASSHHEEIPSFSMDPAEILMMKEESLERDELNQRRKSFHTWQEKDKPLISVGDVLEQAID